MNDKPSLISEFCVLFIISAYSNLLKENGYCPDNAQDTATEGCVNPLNMSSERSNSTDIDTLTELKQRYQRLDDLMQAYVALQALSLEELSLNIFEELMIFTQTRIKQVPTDQWMETLISLGAHPDWVVAFVIYLQATKADAKFHMQQAQAVQTLIKETLVAMKPEGWRVPEIVLLRQQQMITLLSDDIDAALLLSLCWVMDLPKAYRLQP